MALNVALDLNSDYPRVIFQDIITQEAKKELLIYNLKTHKAFCLNETSALVFQLSNGENSVSRIREIVENRLKQPIPEEMIWLALDQLANEDLLMNRERLKTKFSGVSRRQIIKRVGFATMVALPMISSLVTPTAANAASACITPLSLLNTGQLAGLTVAGIAPYNCLSNSDCCPLQNGCTELPQLGICAVTTVGDGTNTPTAPVQICVGLGTNC